MTDFEPKTVVFCCNWCSYAGADLAGTSRLKIKPNFRVIRTMCSGRLEPSFIFYAFAKGADGVLVAGWEGARRDSLGGEGALNA